MEEERDQKGKKGSTSGSMLKPGVIKKPKYRLRKSKNQK
jgi:hypothetical protein